MRLAFSVLLEITWEERHAINEQRLKRRHESQAPSVIQIRSEARGGENDTSRTQPTGTRPPLSAEPGSRQESKEIHLRRKLMSKGKGIVQELESDHPRKKQRTTQEGLDEDILNMISEASRYETSIMRSQIMALKEREANREKEVTKLRGMVLNQNRVIDALKKTVEKLSGIVTEL
ncbi:hypothetical protein L1987_20212 [Smallanthus sonchifolius]|uniref:Uncharacterized protein n=1 Tax=Smallanthus sonchifolius TaxID=185202 RepID=A0ACB9IRZ5_9ASTR|nr:hypothetical protein L1987_20212 [Smallanthus sonchifolius]